MNNKQTVVVIVLGKRISIKGSTQTKISTIFPELKKAQKLPYEPDLTKIEIINSNTYQILKPNTTFGSIVADQKSGIKSIQIRDIDEANRKKNIQFVEYDVLAEQAFSDVLTRIICGDYDVLLDLRVIRKISPGLQTLLAEICQKCKNANRSGRQRQKEESMKIQRLEQLLKQRQQQLKQRIQQLDSLKQEIASQKQHKNEIDPQIIKQKFKQAINKQEISQIMPKNEEQDENNKSIVIVNDLLKQLSNKFHDGSANVKKIKPKQQLKEQEQDKYKDKGITKQKKMYDLLHHSRTFDIQVFGGMLGQYSQKLGEFVEEFVKNQIKQIVSVYFVKGPNIQQFISKIKQNNNFIILFSSANKLFGIFSTDTFGVKVKSESGFLFSLSDSKKYTLKPGNPIWKYSNVELKIGNDALIFSQQTKKEQMKMRIKKSLSDSFNIQQQEIRAMIGGKDHIIIDSFEFLTVSFVNQSKQQKRELKHQGRSLKTQASD